MVLATHVPILGVDPFVSCSVRLLSAPASVGASSAEDPAFVTDHPTRGTASEKDKVRPYHAKESSSGQETADVVAAVLKHAAARDQAAKARPAQKQPPKWMLPLGLNLGVLAVYLMIAPPAWVEMNRIDPPPDEEVVEDLQAGMLFVTSKIESYRARTGRLPVTLVEAGVNAAQAEAIDYTARADSTYLLIGFVGDVDVTFDSARHTQAEAFGPVGQRIEG